MKTRILLSVLSSILVWSCGTVAWSQNVPPPLPGPDLGVAPAAPATPPASPYAAPPSGFAPAPGMYAPAPPPGPMVLAPDQPYPGYPSPPYARPAVVVPAPPMSTTDWYAAIDALFLERNVGSSIPLGSAVYMNNGLPPSEPVGNMYSDDSGFPLTGGIRLELGRKLTDNVTLAANYWGMQQWSVGNTIYGDPNNYTVLLYSPYLQLPYIIGGLDNTLSYSYSSQIQNIEFNALFRVNGDNPFWRLDWLWGFRYVSLCEQFTLSGTDILNNAEEDLTATTSNNLLGVQTGLVSAHAWGDRFQWETGVKAGLMANIYHQHETDAPASLYDTSSGTGISCLFEVSLAARIRLTNALWLRLGYQLYDFTGMALAPRQINSFGHGANVVMDGLSAGLHAAW